jgi:hypothetical protein
VNRGRRVLLAVLVYVTLDLSLPSMPGAFVFDPAESVESAQMSRGRMAADVVPLPAISRAGLATAAPRVDVAHRVEAQADRGDPGYAVVSRLPRAALSPPPASEDPH